MRIPEIVPLTHDLFSPLLELEEQANNKKAEFQQTVDELNKHVLRVETRINQERETIKNRLSELDREEKKLQERIRVITKKKLDAFLRNTAFDDEGEFKIVKARISEIPQEQEALKELLEEIKALPEEKERFSELYDIARKKGQETNEAMKQRFPELKKVFTVINDQFQASVWNEGGFSYEKALSSANNKIYELQKGE
jgi:mRNA-degrading endonuclease HigB of HigAB toxin-antitoxin module